MIDELLARLSSPPVLAVLGGVSIFSFFATLIGVPYFLTRIAPDYFIKPPEQGAPLSSSRGLLVILRNLLGGLLFLLGLLLLVLPGQGLLTVLVGLLLLDFPGKRRFEIWLIRKPAVHQTINRLRRRAGKAELTLRDSWLPPPPSA